MIDKVNDILHRECSISKEPFDEAIKFQSKSNLPFIVAKVIQIIDRKEHYSYFNPIPFHAYTLANQLQNPENRAKIDKIVYLALPRINPEKESGHEESYVLICNTVDIANSASVENAIEEVQKMEILTGAFQSECEKQKIDFQLAFLGYHQIFAIQSLGVPFQKIVDACIQEVNLYFVLALSKCKSHKDLISLQEYHNRVRVADGLIGDKKLQLASLITSSSYDSKETLATEAIAADLVYKSLKLALSFCNHMRDDPDSLEVLNIAHVMHKELIDTCNEIISNPPKIVIHGLDLALARVLTIMSTNFLNKCANGESEINLDIALECLDKAQKLNKNDSLVFSNLGRAYFLDGRGDASENFDKAVKFFEKALAIDENNLDALLFIAQMCLTGRDRFVKDPVKAVKYLEKTVELDKKNVIAHELLLPIYKDGVDGIERDADKALASLVFLGQINFTGENDVTKNYAKSKEYYEDALKIDPHQIEALTGLGEIFLAGEYGVSKDYKKAKEYFEQVLKIDPNQTEPLILLGEIFITGGYGVTRDYAKAKESYEKALEINPEEIVSIIGLGGIYYTGGYGVTKNYKISKEYYERSIVVDSEQIVGHLGLGTIYFTGGDGIDRNFAESKMYYEEALNRDPFAIEAFIGLAEIHYAGGDGIPKDYKKAKWYYEKILMLDENNQQVTEKLNECRRLLEKKS